MFKDKQEKNKKGKDPKQQQQQQQQQQQMFHGEQIQANLKRQQLIRQQQQQIQVGSRLRSTDSIDFHLLQETSFMSKFMYTCTCSSLAEGTGDAYCP